MGQDLVHRMDVYGDYFLKTENTLMMYSAAKTKSDKAIKKIEWTYDGVTWDGWTFFPYVSEAKGDTISVKVTNSDDEFVVQNLEIQYSDFCETQTRDSEFGLCLKSNNFSANGDYIPLNIPFLNFYLSHGETLTGNLTNRKVYLVPENSGEPIDITAATSISGSNLVINMITLGSSLVLEDPTDKFYIALYGDYNNITATFDFDNTNARSKSFKLGLSGLNLVFGETANQLSVYSTSVPFGQVLSSSIGTSSVNLPYLPPGEYVVHVENATKEGYAQVYVNAEELVTVVFSMQPKDLSATGRQPLSDSFSVFRGAFLNSKIKFNSKSRSERLKQKLNDLVKEYEAEYQKVKGKVKGQKDDAFTVADIVYLNGFTRSSVAYHTQYTESMFINNFEELKSQFLDPLTLPLSSSKSKNKSNEKDAKSPSDNVSKSYVSDYPPFPDPIVSVYNMKVQGTVPNGYVSLPNKNQDFGGSSGGIAVEADKNYAPFMFGDLPILHISKSKETIAKIYEVCMAEAEAEEDPVGESFCKFQRNIADEAWKVLMDYFAYESTVKIRYTITGMYDSQERRIVHDHVYDFGSFVKENGDIYMAASKYIYSPEGTDINDGWLLGKQPFIYVPDYLTNPKVRLEMFTKIPSDIFTDLDIFNLKVYIAGGLVEDERELPSVTSVVADASADIVTEVSSTASIKTPIDHGKLLLSEYKMLPVSEEAHDDGFYFDKSNNKSRDHSFEVILETSPLNQFTVTGVMVSIKHGEEHYPDLLTYEKGGKIYSGSQIVWPEDGNQNRVRITVKPKDIFNDTLKFDSSKDNALALRFQLVLDDSTTTEVEELIGPVNYVINIVPSYNMQDLNIMNIPTSKTPLMFYSKPNGVFGKKALAVFFKTLAESDLNTSTNSSSFKYNDASIPYGGKMKAHRYSHFDGRHLDIRYPHANNNDWDQSKPHAEVTGFCGSAMGALAKAPIFHHGFKKFNAIKNYLWVKRLSIHIHNNYQILYPDPLMMLKNPALEDHKGDLIKYIAGEEFCGEPSIATSNPTLKDLCQDLISVYSPINLSEIDGLISYVKETRENIEEINFLIRNRKFTVEMLLSNGAGQMSCFPVKNPLLGFNYDNNWHEKLYSNGTFPDGVKAKVGATEILPWTKQPEAVKYGTSKPDYAHLSHIHVRVEEK